MADKKAFDVIIIGGSYSGLSAAMALGRSLRDVLIIDSGKPCNASALHSHNFITQDGEAPGEITAKAKVQVQKYDTVHFVNSLAVGGKKTETGFAIVLDTGEAFFGRKLIFATGIKDIMPEIDGFADCWGKTAIHCPYCHGYEFKNRKTGVLANGDFAYRYVQLVRNLTDDLTIFTNGKAEFTDDQRVKFTKRHIEIVEKEIERLDHEDGNVQSLTFKDGTSSALSVIYSRPAFVQHCTIPEVLGCELSEQGLLKVDMSQKTSVDGVFACGDATTPVRSVAFAVAAGNVAGASVNSELTQEEF